MIFSCQEKNLGTAILYVIQNAQNLIKVIQLGEPHLQDRSFTWNIGQVDHTWVQMCRFLVNLDWLAYFPGVQQIFLPCFC